MLKQKCFAVITAASILSIFPLSVSASDNGKVLDVTFDDSSAYSLSGASLSDGRNGQAVSLDGTDDHAVITNADAINKISGDFTINVWCKPDSLTTWARIFDIGTGTDEYMFLAASTGAPIPRFAIKHNGTEQYIDAGREIKLGKWSMITVKKSGNITSIYINGVLTNRSDAITYNISDIGTTTQNWIGRSMWAADPYFDGMIDDFSVYDTALSDEEIIALAADAYTNEMADIEAEKEAEFAKKISSYNRLLIETHYFDDESGEEVYQISNGKRYKAVCDILNYKKDDADIIISDSTGFTTDIITLASGDDYRYETYFSGDDFDKFDIFVSDGTPSDSGITIEDLYFDGIRPVVDVTASENNDVMLMIGEYNPEGTLVSLQQKETVLNKDEINKIYMDNDANDTQNIFKAYILDTENKSGKNIIYYSSDQTDTENNGSFYETGAIYKSQEVTFPEASPADSDDTTGGAHDPTIFKDPVSGKYYAYSSHNLISESSDLINWEKHTVDITVPTSSKEFIESTIPNYGTVNPTYWAPDIVYEPSDTEHPYWLYVSVSCGLGGQNSVIGLLKSDSPLFWCDDNAEVTDCGVVHASQSGYATNSIDSNIYTDPDGSRYFIWGSFWKGIHGAELTSDGLVKGVDYTSNETILESSGNVGVRLYSTPKGVCGPEGPFTVRNDDTGYIYMFTSYGWLGSNYNVRVARTDMTMGSIINGSDPHHKFVDQLGRKVGTTHSEAGDSENLWGYKAFGSYRLGDGSMEYEKNADGDYYINVEDGDDLTYLGSGHNSVLHDDDGNWYLVEHTRKVVNAAAFLQVHKMMWDENGWPVIFPMVYSGEELQSLPETMLYGTWDLSSVGQTIKSDSSLAVDARDAYRGTDLPVLSAKIIVSPDHNLYGDSSEPIGTWSFDGNYTMTFNFTEDGDTDDFRFYKNGDSMKLYVSTGYDKDQRRSVLQFTGTDNNEIAQIGKLHDKSTAVTAQ